jgi:hypothetical protein
MSRLDSLSAGGRSDVGSVPSSPVSPSNGLLRPKPGTVTGMMHRKSLSSLSSGGTAGGGQEERRRIGDGRKKPLVSSAIPRPPVLKELGIQTRLKAPEISGAAPTTFGRTQDDSAIQLAHASVMLEVERLSIQICPQCVINMVRLLSRLPIHPSESSS